MKCRLLRCGFAAFVLVLFAANTSFAHDVTIGRASRLGNGPTIEAGTYRIELIKNQDSLHAVFYKGDDEVACAPVTLVSEASKARQTEVYSEVRDEGRIITLIRLQGSKEALIFEQTREGLQSSGKSTPVVNWVA